MKKPRKTFEYFLSQIVSVRCLLNERQQIHFFGLTL